MGVPIATKRTWYLDRSSRPNPAESIGGGAGLRVSLRRVLGVTPRGIRDGAPRASGGKREVPGYSPAAARVPGPHRQVAAGQGVGPAARPALQGHVAPLEENRSRRDGPVP